MNLNDIFLDMLPKIDLHGYDRESARVAVDDFVADSIFMGYDKIVIIHGIGTGIVKDVVHTTLSRNSNVLSYHLVTDNIGCTLVELVKN